MKEALLTLKSLRNELMEAHLLTGHSSYAPYIKIHGRRAGMHNGRNMGGVATCECDLARHIRCLDGVLYRLEKRPI